MVNDENTVISISSGISNGSDEFGFDTLLQFSPAALVYLSDTLKDK